MSYLNETTFKSEFMVNSKTINDFQYKMLESNKKQNIYKKLNNIKNEVILNKNKDKVNTNMHFLSATPQIFILCNTSTNNIPHCLIKDLVYNIPEKEYLIDNCLINDYLTKRDVINKITKTHNIEQILKLIKIFNGNTKQFVIITDNYKKLVSELELFIVNNENVNKCVNLTIIDIMSIRTKYKKNIKSTINFKYIPANNISDIPNILNVNNHTFLYKILKFLKLKNIKKQ